MEEYGLLVLIAFSILLIAIFSSCSKEGYTNYTIPQIGPKKQSLPTQKEPKGYVDIAELPGAPVSGLAEANSLPFQDPALVKANLQQLNELKQDMDGFATFEQPHLDQRSDPAVKLPLTRFIGDYQRIQDEVRVLQRNAGIQSSLHLDDMFDMAANLRFLQRTYRVYAANQIVPASDQQISHIGLRKDMSSSALADEQPLVKEGFADAAVPNPITVDEVRNLSQRLAVEIKRLSASGTTDPVIQARVGILTNMRQTVDDIVSKLERGDMLASQIPIMKEDYDKFLPVLGNTSAGLSGLISKAGGGSLASLFNSYDIGDISGSDIAAALFEKYADDLIKGTSWSFKLAYTSPNEVDVARSLVANTIATAHPGTLKGARGEFDETIRALDMAGFEDAANSFTGARPPSKQATEIGSFDWKKRVDDIQKNMIRAGLKPSDYGALKSGDDVSENFSWRGHAKMLCSRLATHADPATPEQMGCPPVSWKGWRM